MIGRTLRAVLLGAAVLGATPTLGACSDPEDLVHTTDDDAAVNGAIQEARRTLPVFWEKYEAQAAGYDAFALKVGLDADGGGVEHIWVSDITREGDKVFGHVANDPVDIATLSNRDRVEVEIQRVSDWQYTRDGKLYGHFTTRALFPKANPEQRAMAAELFAPTPLEAGSN